MDQVGISGGIPYVRRKRASWALGAGPILCVLCKLPTESPVFGGHGRTTLELAKLVVQVRYLSDCRCRWAIKGVPGDTQH